MSTTCPQAIRTTNRRKKLKKKWTGKAWKEKRLAFIKQHGGVCEWCGSTEYLAVHHPQRNAYGDEVYMDFYLSGCVLLCKKCHAATHVGRVLCEREHPDGENHYRWHDTDMCGYCFVLEHPEIKENADREKRERARKQREARKRESIKAKEWKRLNKVK